MINLKLKQTLWTLFGIAVAASVLELVGYILTIRNITMAQGGPLASFSAPVAQLMGMGAFTRMIILMVVATVFMGLMLRDALEGKAWAKILVAITFIGPSIFRAWRMATGVVAAGEAIPSWALVAMAIELTLITVIGFEVLLLLPIGQVIDDNYDAKPLRLFAASCVALMIGFCIHLVTTEQYATFRADPDYKNVDINFAATQFRVNGFTLRGDPEEVHKLAALSLSGDREIREKARRELLRHGGNPEAVLALSKSTAIEFALVEKAIKATPKTHNPFGGPRD